MVPGGIEPGAELNSMFKDENGVAFGVTTIIEEDLNTTVVYLPAND